jgi:hypothetical protein
MISVTRKRSGYFSDTKVQVSSGSFQTEPFTSNGEPLLPGKYVVEISTPVAEFQPPDVQSVVGEHYSKLSGPLLKKGPYGRLVKYQSTFEVAGPSDTQKDAAARTAKANELREWRTKQCYEIPDAVERLSGEKLDAAKRQEMIDSCLHGE